MPNDLCPSHGSQRCHLLLKADSRGVVWLLYLCTQKVSVVLDSTTQKRLESSAVRLSEITALLWFCTTPPHDLKKHLAEEAFYLKCSDVWHHRCWQLSQVPFSSVWNSRTSVTLTLENSSRKGSVTFVITLSPSGKVKTNHCLQVACACKCLVEKEPLCQEDKSWVI